MAGEKATEAGEENNLVTPPGKGQPSKVEENNEIPSAPKTKKARAPNPKEKGEEVNATQDSNTQPVALQEVTAGVSSTTPQPEEASHTPSSVNAVNPDNMPGKATAVKAKAKPLGTSVKVEPKAELLAKMEDIDDQTAAEVLACLNRRATSELHLEGPAEPSPIAALPGNNEALAKQAPAPTLAPAPKPAPAPKKAPEPKPAETKANNMNSADKKMEVKDDEDESEEEYRRKEQQVKQKKEAHARFMRFKRSLVSSLTQICWLVHITCNNRVFVHDHKHSKVKADCGAFLLSCHYHYCQPCIGS